MTRRISQLFTAMAVLFMASPLFAQTTAGGGTGSAHGDIALAAGIGMAIASGLCGLGQGKAIASTVEALARNPGAEKAIRFAFILGLVLIESLALYTLAIIFAKVK